MNDLQTYIQQIKLHLITTHSDLLRSFDKEVTLKKYQPKNGGWTVNEVLEHVALTSHFLLILIDKGANKSIKNIQNQSLEKLLLEFDYDLKRLDAIGITQSFEWTRPEHMQPKGIKTDIEVKEELVSQLNRCLNQLEALKNGEGLLYKTTMTVNQLGKLNVYEYIYFLSKHAERHVQQMIKIENEVKQNSNSIQFEELTTDRLKLRKFTPEVLDYIYQTLSEAKQIRLLGLSSKEELDKEREKYEKGRSTYNKSFLYFHLVEKESDKIIGWCGYHTWYTSHDRAEIGYGLFSDENKRKGFMTEALSPIIEYGFKTMKLHRIEAFISTYNQASLKLVSNLNFVKEGLLREHYFANNQMEDSLVYSLLRREYT